ncbi:uncharacterized protein LOC144703829 [Wolffia australiana]
MQFAAAGGFLSSSASGFSDGLALLLPGRTKDRPIKVSPWKRYLLVGEGIDPEAHTGPDSRKTRLLSKCAFICFGRGFSKDGGLANGGGGGDSSGNGGIEHLQPRSSLKKQVEVDDIGQVNAARPVDLRRVHWRDGCGNDLAEVREFDAGEEEPSDEEREKKGIRGCACVIQ